MSSLDILREYGLRSFVYEHPLQFGVGLGALLAVVALANGGYVASTFIWFSAIGCVLGVAYSYAVDFVVGRQQEPDRRVIPESQHASAEPDAARSLHALRERYANGELTEAQFERKLDHLLETETVEAAEDYVSERERERDTATE
ncbi:SHOCT domain-containing protein [Haloferax sp. S1W]|uniref:SHOCT domain-containing protein n=1 Tax=Haloferax sp. S1W TaxID=3377110 RepID=UPI0037C709D8